MNVTEYLNSQYFGSNQNEQNIMTAVIEDVRACDLFIDLGASFGVYTKFTLENNLDARLICIEPDRFRFSELQRNVEKWRNKQEVQLLQNIVYDRSIDIEFYTDETQKSGLIGGSSKHSNFYKVSSVRLDDLVSEVSKNLVIIIDIEGSEFGAILGAQNLIENNEVTIILEVHTWGDLLMNRGKPSEVLRKLRKLGFGAIKIHGRYVLRKSNKGRYLLQYNIFKEATKETIRRLLNR